MNRRSKFRSRKFVVRRSTLCSPNRRSFHPLGEELSSLDAIEALIDAELEPLSQPIKGWTAQQNAVFNSAYAKTANIVGVAEGSGPLAGETIVIGAHYDHIGRGDYGSNAPAEQIGQIHNGADDNATGTSAVMELARRFGARGESRRTSIGVRLLFRRGAWAARVAALRRKRAVAVGQYGVDD